MKNKDKKGLTGKSQKELDKILHKKRTELLMVKAEVKVGKEKNLKKMKNIRREIAQILTISREKELIETEEKIKKGDGKS